MALNDLKVILALNGNERVEYAEEEIFSCFNLYTYYLERLCDSHIMQMPKGYQGPAYRACRLADELIIGRWPVAEKLIATDNYSAYRYALLVIQGRFPEAEPTFALYSDYSFEYAVDIIKGRWPEGEAAIATDPYRSYMYAKYVIQGRFPEGESIIHKSQYSDLYESYLRSRSIF